MAIAFRMGLFNIGVEGQYRLATIIAAAGGRGGRPCPGPLHVVCIIVVAMRRRRAVWAGIVAVLKVTRGVSEVISSIMLNFIAAGPGVLPAHRPVPGSAAGPTIVSTADDPRVGLAARPQLRSSTLLGLANPPRQLYGFLIIAASSACCSRCCSTAPGSGSTCGPAAISPSAASASGVNARAMVIKTMLLSGAVAGLIGLPDLLGEHPRLHDQLHRRARASSGIAVALLGRNKPGRHRVRPRCCSPSSTGRWCRCRSRDYPASVVTIIQGTIVLAVVIANEIARRVARRAAERGSAGAEPGSGIGDPRPPARRRSRTTDERTGGAGMSTALTTPETARPQAPVTALLTGGEPVAGGCCGSCARRAGRARRPSARSAARTH